uniref:One cut domain family member n=1 Tax=Rhabditophanes sp. KR3021 TaxID=114890 RepID=A0AC35U829_9BILA
METLKRNLDINTSNEFSYERVVQEKSYSTSPSSFTSSASYDEAVKIGPFESDASDPFLKNQDNRSDWIEEQLDFQEPYHQEDYIEGNMPNGHVTQTSFPKITPYHHHQSNGYVYDIKYEGNDALPNEQNHFQMVEPRMEYQMPEQCGLYDEDSIDMYEGVTDSPDNSQDYQKAEIKPLVTTRSSNSQNSHEVVSSTTPYNKYYEVFSGYNNFNESEEIDTKEVARRITTELKRFSIPQVVFAQRVLCRSQGTLSDLLRNPKPWNKLKSGRETFHRMAKWLDEPEQVRMSALRQAVCKRKEDGPSHPVISTNSLIFTSERENRASSSSSGSKKGRIVFTSIQKRTLRAIFRETRHPTREIQASISKQLGLDMTTVNNFFMNARRRRQEDLFSDDHRCEIDVEYIINKSREGSYISSGSDVIPAKNNQFTTNGLVPPETVIVPKRHTIANTFSLQQKNDQ